MCTAHSALKRAFASINSFGLQCCSRGDPGWGAWSLYDVWVSLGKWIENYKYKNPGPLPRALEGPWTLAQREIYLCTTPLLHSHPQRDVWASQARGKGHVTYAGSKGYSVLEAEPELSYVSSLCGPSISPSSSVTKETLKKEQIKTTQLKVIRTRLVLGSCLDGALPG